MLFMGKMTKQEHNTLTWIVLIPPWTVHEVLGLPSQASYDEALLTECELHQMRPLLIYDLGAGHPRFRHYSVLIASQSRDGQPSLQVRWV